MPADNSMYSYDLSGPTGRSGGYRQYPDPFLIHSKYLMPRSVAELMRWCESIWIHNGTYSRALKRVIAYFITKIDVTDCSEEEKQKFIDMLEDTLHITQFMTDAGADFMAYGNCFVSMIVPFKRFLRCTKCKTELPIEHTNFKYSGGKFNWKCTKCNCECNTVNPVDRRISDESKLKLRRWSPHEIKIVTHPITEKKIYLWEPPPDIVARVRQGDKYTIQEFPKEMLEAINAGKMFEFADDVIYHMCEHTLAGLRTGGWGIPQTLNNFSQTYYIQMAKMYNEIFMQEYIVPFRVVSPAARSSNGDPIVTTNIGSYNAKLLSMVDEHRRNPGGWYTLPFPVEYQALSGEGIQAMTYEHIDQATDELLNAAGVPAEFYKGNMEFQVLPAALRLFQQSWPQIQTQFNSMLDWLMRNLAVVYNWDKAKARLQPVTLADDLEKRQILMQLMAGNKVSTDTFLSNLGLSSKDELNKIMEERRLLAEKEDRFNAEMAQKQQLTGLLAGGGSAGGGAAPGVGPGAGGQPAGGGMPGGGGGVPGGPSQPMTPDDLMAQADQLAQKLVGMPYEQRRSMLKSVKDSNETLWSLVKTKMQKIRDQAQQAGGYQVIQNMTSAQQGAPQQ